MVCAAAQELTKKQREVGPTSQMRALGRKSCPLFPTRRTQPTLDEGQPVEREGR